MDRFQRWRDLDLIDGVVFVRRSKDVSSHRKLPLNRSARFAFERMWARAKELGFTDPDHYIWPASQWGKIDPLQPTRKWDTAWRRLCDVAQLPGLRFQDLRHTIITELAGMGVPDHVMVSISGHLSRRMRVPCSHIRMEARRKVLEELDARRKI